MRYYFQMLHVTKMNLPAKMENAFEALGIAMAKMTAVTNQMKKVVLVRKSIRYTLCPKLFKLIFCCLKPVQNCSHVYIILPLMKV